MNERYKSYADALRRFNLKLDMIKEDVASFDMKTSEIGILSESVADETKNLLSKRKKETEIEKQVIMVMRLAKDGSLLQ
jgi:hypothetical protein